MKTKVMPKWLELWVLMAWCSTPGHQQHQFWVCTHALPDVYGLSRWNHKTRAYSGFFCILRFFICWIEDIFFDFKSQFYQQPHFCFEIYHVNRMLFAKIRTSILSCGHYDLCPVDSCVNLLSALDSRNGVMSMRTSPHLRALLINNNPCGQQFS